MHSLSHSLPFLVFIGLSLLSFTSKHDTDVVRWTLAAKPIKNGEFMLLFEAKMNYNWYIYPQEQQGETFPTTFYFLPNEAVEFSAQAMDERGEPISVNTAKVYKNKVVFSTSVRLKEPNTQLIGYVRYVSCDHTKCQSPKDVPFEFRFSE